MAISIGALLLGAVLIGVGLRSSSSAAVVPPTQQAVLEPTPTATVEQPAEPQDQETPTRVEPTPAYAGTYAGTPTPDPSPHDGGELPRSQDYTVQQGDTLSGIAVSFGCTVDEITTANNISPNSIWPGQRLTIPVGASECGPALKLIPDSELVYGPAYIHFDLEGFVASQGGYLASYVDTVEGLPRTGAEIVQLVAQRHSVGPRVLLALLELRAGWVTDPNPPADTLDFPMGAQAGYLPGLFDGLSWAAAELNSGYYGWKYSGWSTIRLADGSRLAIAPGLNPGTAAIHNYLAQVAFGEEWLSLVGTEGFLATYESLFGNPFAYSIDPLLPADLTQPELLLPWEASQTWYLTGGPHSGWVRGSGWAALDFVPPDEDGCRVSAEWATAAAAGEVLRSENGEVVIDLDGDGYEQSGWVLIYMHMAARDRVQSGTRLERGQPVGHPSCEGGYADATHLHFARRYNGEWVPAGNGPLPLVLSGWTAHEAIREYDGTLTNGDQVREACQCTVDSLNGLVSDNAPPE